MKKKGYIASLVALLLVYGLANLILFLLIPDGRTDFSSFWIAWSFTFPLNVATAIFITVLLIRSKADEVAKVPLLFTIQYVFAFVYLKAGFIIMFNEKNIVSIAWIVEASITVAYIIAVMFSWLGMSYITRNIKYTKKKTFYIRSLQADIDACIPAVSDEKAKAALIGLSDKIRYSDPMSHSSLEDCELKLQSIISDIASDASSGNYDAVLELVVKATSLLDSRNAKCKLLK